MLPVIRDDLKSKHRYNPETGHFFRAANAGKWKEGALVGSVDSHGYVQIKTDGRLYLAHRLAWLHFYGTWPEKHIDHINGIRDDNRICNLRLADRAQNNANSCKRKDNASGFKGVSECGGRWRAQIQIQGRKRHLGVFATAEDASAAYQDKARELFGEFARQP